MKNIKNWQLAVANTRQDEEIKKVKQRVTVLEEAENCLPLMEGVEICSKPKPGYKSANDFSSLTLSDVATESGFKWNFCVSVQKQDVSTLLDLDSSTLPFTTATVCVDKSKANAHLDDLNFGFYYDNLKECSVDKIKTLKELRDAANASSDPTSAILDMQTLPEYRACEMAPLLKGWEKFDPPEIHCGKINEGYEVLCGTRREMVLTEPFQNAAECTHEVLTDERFRLLRDTCAAESD